MQTSSELPRIFIPADDFDRLQNMAEAPGTPRDVAEYLQRELDRAEIGTPPENGARRVLMGDHVRFRNNASGEEKDVQLVYPKDADPAQQKISVLTPVGAALVGLAEGQSIAWTTRGGAEHTLTVLKVG